MRRLLRAPGTAVTVGTALSVALSLILLVATSVSGADAFLIGLVGTGIAVLLEVLVRVEQLAEDQTLRRELGAFAPLLDEVALATKGVVEEYGGRGPEAALRERLDAVVEDLGDLREGRITSRGGDYRLLIRSMAAARVRADAVTNLVGGGPDAGPGDTNWWSSEVGRAYWRENVVAIARGVRICRIFILDADPATQPSVARMLAEQRAAGVDVRWVLRSTVEAGYHVNLVVWDGAVAWEARTNAQGLQYENVLLHAPRDVARLTRTFEVLRTASRALEPRTP